MILSNHFMSKLGTSISPEGRASYTVEHEGSKLSVNDWIGRELTLKFQHLIHCLGCNKKIKKSYGQGYCFGCLQTLARCDMCIMKPETCHYHKGTCREPEWGLAHCFKEHVVYLANTSGVKVGVTRRANTPHRWIDQGATQALPWLKTKDRKSAGFIEKTISAQMNDKTNWRKMLSGSAGPLDLKALAEETEEFLPDGVEFDFCDEELIEIAYPVEAYPEKIKSIGLDKNPEIQKTLKGVKGQYLIFENEVFNWRKHQGYVVEVSVNT